MFYTKQLKIGDCFYKIRKMIGISTMRNVVGFGLKGLGFFWSFSDRFLCGKICGDVCSASQSQHCSMIFLFVGIIFIVCGYALIVMKDKERKSLKTKRKKE